MMRYRSTMFYWLGILLVVGGTSLRADVQKGAFGVYWVPTAAVGKSGVGLEVFDRRHGVSFWVTPDSFSWGSGVLKYPCPHRDYHLHSQHGAYGAFYLHSIPVSGVFVILGLGVSGETVSYIEHSNVTGWEYEGGGETTTSLDGQIGCALRIAETIRLRLGHDLRGRWFVGGQTVW